jgi:hypothetical protein
LLLVVRCSLIVYDKILPSTTNNDQQATINQ